MLENEGLAICDNTLGYAVKKLTTIEVRGYLSPRETLELFAALMVIKRITPSEIRSLEENLNSTEASVKKMIFILSSNARANFMRFSISPLGQPFF